MRIILLISALLLLGGCDFPGAFTEEEVQAKRLIEDRSSFLVNCSFRSNVAAETCRKIALDVYPVTNYENKKVK